MRVMDCVPLIKLIKLNDLPPGACFIHSDHAYETGRRTVFMVLRASSTSLRSRSGYVDVVDISSGEAQLMNENIEVVPVECIAEISY